MEKRHRRPPRPHHVRSHTRKGHRVNSYPRGSGSGVPITERPFYDVQVGKGKNRHTYMGVTFYKERATRWLKEAKEKGLHNPKLNKY